MRQEAAELGRSTMYENVLVLLHFTTNWNMDTEEDIIDEIPIEEHRTNTQFLIIFVVSVVVIAVFAAMMIALAKDCF
jgi:hypothetical protein